MARRRAIANGWTEVPGKGGVQNFRSVALRLLVSVREETRGTRVEVMTLTAGKPSDEKIEQARLELLGAPITWTEVGVVDPARRVFRIGPERTANPREYSLKEPGSADADYEYLGRDEWGEYVMIGSRFRSRCIGCDKQHELGERVVWSPTRGGACCMACWSANKSACWGDH